MGSRQLAQFVISIDLEMSWGGMHHDLPHDDTPYRREREIVDGVLSLMSKYGMTATWAVVGHLFLAECSNDETGRPHSQIPRPDYRWLDRDWYDPDPVSTLDAAPTWYGPDLVQSIRECPVPQEVASHSFGHIIVGDPDCDADAFRADLIECKTIAEAQGIDLQSFVYPRNKVGHVEVLSETGFSSYRSPTPDRFAGMSLPRRAAGAVKEMVRPSTTFGATRHDKIVDIPQTYMFDPASKRAERYGTAIWSLLMRRRLRHAVRTQSLFHLWFHTHNLSSNTDRAWSAMEALFIEARKHIDAGTLENVTMQTIAQRLMAVDHHAEETQ